MQRGKQPGYQRVQILGEHEPREGSEEQSRSGKIVYTCQVFRDNNRNQICIMDADGSHQHRLTQADNADFWYPSLSPDRSTIVFSSGQSGQQDVYEMDLDGNQSRLTYMGELYSPEISPDQHYVAFTNASGVFSSIWIMNRDGSNPRELYAPSEEDATDPTWSPDSRKILFAVRKGDLKKLYTINLDGSGLHQVNSSFTTRGRSDWSRDGGSIAGYTGGPWKRIIDVMNFDGTNLRTVVSKGNAQAPSFSPDSASIVFTGYIDNMGDEDGCEIYILRLVDQELIRLTDNNYCDFQPRWGP